MTLEALWYEVSPYVYCAVGLLSAAFSNSDLGFVFSALLLTASLVIFRLRRLYRRPDRVKFRKYSQFGAEALREKQRDRRVVRANQVEATGGIPEIASSVRYKVSALIRTRAAELLRQR